MCVKKPRPTSTRREHSIVAEITVLVCDVDQAQARTVRHYTVTVDGQTREMDLCDRHAGIFAPGAGPGEAKASPASTARARKAAAAPGRRGPGRPRKVTTMEEIEKLKEEGTS